MRSAHSRGLVEFTRGPGREENENAEKRPNGSPHPRRRLILERKVHEKVEEAEEMGEL